jgi:hypothetical protein
MVDHSSLFGVTPFLIPKFRALALDTVDLCISEGIRHS